MPALTRTRDPETSHAAAAAVERRLHRQWVRLALRWAGSATAKQLEVILRDHCSAESVRGSIAELRRDGELDLLGRRRNPSGTLARVWKLRE